MLHDKRHDACTVGKTGECTAPGEMMGVAEIVVGKTYMLNVLEVGESTRAEHDSALLDEVIKVSCGAKEEGCPGPEDGFEFVVDALACCKDADVVVIEVYRERANWVTDCTV